MENPGFGIAPRRNLSATEHQWFAEDDDAGYMDWVHGKENNNRVGAWSRRRGGLGSLYGAEQLQLQWENGGEKIKAKMWVPVSESMGLMGTHDTMSARSQAIADYHKEMMKLVRDKPDWNYELTLQDIVEKSAAVEGVEKDAPEENAKSVKETTGKEEKKKKKQYVGTKQRAGGGGVFPLKMFLPVALAGKRTTNPGRGGSKVSPRQTSNDGQTMYEDVGKSYDRSGGGFGCWSFYGSKKWK